MVVRNNCVAKEVDMGTGFWVMIQIAALLVGLPPRQEAMGHQRLALCGLSRPGSLAVWRGRIWVGDGPVVRRYDLKTGTHLGASGQAGEGPGCFLVPPGGGVTLRPDGGFLVVNGQKKWALLNETGTWCSEGRKGTWSWKVPREGGWLVQGIAVRERVNTWIALLLDEQGRSLGELWSWKHAIQDAEQRIDLAPTYQEVVVVGERLVLAPDEQMRIRVYSAGGRLERVLEQPYERLPMTDGYRQRVLGYFRSGARYREALPVIEKMFFFPSFFPAVRHLYADEKGVYAQTYGGGTGEAEFYRFRWDGTFAGVSRVPWQDPSGINWECRSCVSDGFFYDLVEGEQEQEPWYLISAPLLP